MTAIIILVMLAAFDVWFLTSAWRTKRIKQKRAARLRAMSGVIVRGGR